MLRMDLDRTILGGLASGLITLGRMRAMKVSDVAVQHGVVQRVNRRPEASAASPATPRNAARNAARNSVARRWRAEQPIFALGLVLSVALHAAGLVWMGLPASDLEATRNRTRAETVDLPILTGVALPAVQPPTPAVPPAAQMRTAEPTPPARMEHSAPGIVAAVPVPDAGISLSAAGATPPANPAVHAPMAAGTSSALALPAARGQYEQQIARWVERQRDYPLAARRRGVEGIAIIRLLLAADGSLLNAQIVRDTGVALLDRAALGMVERAAPYPALPVGLGGSQVEILVPIHFSLGT